jgi:outer membrane murein-binding lipoprotein Lpp
LLEKEKTMTNNVSNKWEELKALVESLEEDVQKNASGNKAAGTRARKGLRTLKTAASELVKLTLGKE